MSLYARKVHLRPNALTGNPEDHLASVSIGSAARTQRGIIERMVAEGVPGKSEFLRAIPDETNHVREKFLLEGHIVNDELTRYSPAITDWTGKERFTHGHHRATVNTSLSRNFLRKFTHVGIHMVGMRGTVAYISLTTDMTMRQHNIMTPGDNLLIVGLP
jgi:hypothetical protein